MIGLMEALQRYDQRDGVEFESFAIHRIKGAMIDELRADDILSRSDRKLQRAISAAIIRLQHRYGVEAPASEHVAKELDMTVAEYHAARQRTTRSFLYLDAPKYSDEDDHYDALITAELIDAEETADKLDFRRDVERLVEAVAKLPEAEQQVLLWRHEDEKTYDEIALIMKCSPSRVCQIYTSAVTRLKRLAQPSATVKPEAQKTAAELEAEHRAWLAANVVGQSFS